MTAPTPDEAAAVQHPTPWRVDDNLGWIVDANGREVCHADGVSAARFIVDALAERDALRAEVERSTELGQQAITAEARAVRELEAENAGLRTELLTTQQILAHAERQRDEAEARLATQQPVIDAVETWDAAWVMGTAGVETGTALHNALVRYEGTPRRAVASGSVEADTVRVGDRVATAPPGERCAATTPGDGWGGMWHCTIPAGHPGAHVASAADAAVVAVWPQSVDSAEADK